jgi:ABC-2 type transport system ATP-binding protein
MLVNIERLKVQYGKTTALEITSPIGINEGDRIGIIGSNGAGKSTLVKSLLGIVDYEGVIDSSIAPSQMAAHMQFNEYTDNMVVKYIMEAILQTKVKTNTKLQELIHFFEFDSCLSKKYKALSGGQKQRFTIILVMMQDAPLTFYDEVTSGLDFETRQKLVEKLVEWYRDKDDSFCIVSHYYEELEQLANKLLLLDHGKVVDFGTKEELFQRYCGKAIIVLENNAYNQKLLSAYPQLHSPSHLLTLACNTTQIEEEITMLLLQHNINYKRSNNDIEIMFTNALVKSGELGKGDMKNE